MANPTEASALSRAVVMTCRHVGSHCRLPLGRLHPCAGCRWRIWQHAGGCAAEPAERLWRVVRPATGVSSGLKCWSNTILVPGSKSASLHFTQTLVNPCAVCFSCHIWWSPSVHAHHLVVLQVVDRAKGVWNDKYADIKSRVQFVGGSFFDAGALVLCPCALACRGLRASSLAQRYMACINVRMRAELGRLLTLPPVNKLLEHWHNGNTMSLLLSCRCAAGGKGPR